MKKVLGLAALCLFLLAGTAMAGSDKQTYADSAVGASASRLLYVSQPLGRDWPQIDYIVFFLKTSAVSGTVTATVEMLDGTDIYNLDFFLISSTAASGNPIINSGTALNTAGNYIISVRLADFGNQVLGPIRLRITTAGASGVTVGGKASVYSIQ